MAKQKYTKIQKYSFIVNDRNGGQFDNYIARH